MSIKGIGQDRPLHHQIVDFLSSVNFKKISETDIKRLGELEKTTYDLAKQALSPQEKVEEKEPIEDLIQDKHLLTINQSDRPEISLVLNTLYHTPPALTCSYYERPQVPFISNYHYITANPAIIRLEGSALASAPEALKQAVGDLKNKKIDLFYVISDGRYITEKKSDILNLATHCWAYPDLQKNEREMKTDVDMGLFPIFGVDYAHSDPAAIAFNGLKPMEVYAHNNKYSPNNAHFKIDKKCPVQVFWIAAKQKERVLITKFLMITDLDQPLGEAIAASYKGCPNLIEHIDRMEAGISRALQGIDLVIQLFKNGPEAMAREAFFSLPEFIQNLTFKHIYLLHGSPQKVHRDFGRASVCMPSEIPLTYVSTPQQIAAALEGCLKELTGIFVTSQKELFAHPKLIKDEREEQMIALAQQFRENDSTAMEWFDALFDDSGKDDVFHAVWELRGSPKGDIRFGSDYFYKRASNEERAQAILLAIARS